MVSLSPTNLEAADLTPDQLEQGSSPWRNAWARLRKNKLAVFGGIVLIALTGLCLFAPLFFDLSYQAQGLTIGGLPPGSKVVKIYDAVADRGILEVSNVEQLTSTRAFGTGPEADRIAQELAAGNEIKVGDRLYRPSIYLLGSDAPHGRDLLARILYGGRVSLMVGLVATIVALVIGVTYGAIAGFYGGKIDAAMMRLVDILYAMPFTIFVILLMVFVQEPTKKMDVWFNDFSIFGAHLFRGARGLGNILLLFAAIGAVEWLTMARIVRGQIMSIKKMEYIEAARSLGLGKRRIIFRHMLPNVLGPIIVYTTLTIPAVMLLEAFLSFLGLGVQPPMSSWGVLIKDGAEKMEEFWWLLVFPGGFFSLTLFSLNFLGDGLRDALDVRSAKD
jgi:oligopeptide transport system permease protein